jgi:hypothetical protein
VTWDGSDRTTTFVGSSRLDAAILAADIAVGKLVPVVVRAAGGSLSNALNFTVNNPVPVLTSLSTTKANAGGPGFTLTLSGSNFVTNSVTRWDGADRATTYVSASEIRASILENDLFAGGLCAVTVVNPIPAGGTSGTIYVTVADFTMAASPPSASVTAGQSATFTVTVTPQNGSFDSAVSFSCLGLPKGCKATFSPTTVTPGASAVTTTMTLTTTARSGSTAAATSGPSGPFPPALALLLLVPVFLSRLRALKPAFRRTVLRSLAACALLCLVVLLSSCGAGGGGSQDSGTPAGTYGLQAQGTSGNLRVTADLTLVVD